ncbi:calcium-binding and coiled-coil domain-containing protein 2 isoform X2 [Fukomys damarensis]|uniref:calcium-binding and coiled-coil domain-containing protein 2 isoform X2 n=2 Tax=Fukomys damarensis TaxID=885580 RepID=UPI0005402501|nr:calcium-binding and coiled-coil domain-containing protein 2 isoform X2 [Fukomys damarensis]
MENAEEDPPSSAVMLDQASFSQVIFNNVEKFYIPGGDVTCYYVFTQQFAPRRKDWIGIFKVGWKTTREYYTFMWVALPSDPSAKQQEVQFRAYYLPKDDEYYQFCYVDQDGMVRGASIPFQFRPESEEDILIVTTKVKVEETEQHKKELCQENQELRARCAHLEGQNSAAQAELRRKQEELETLQSVRKRLEQESEEQKTRWDSERLQLKEQDRKLRSENEQLGASVAELRSQLLSQEREMEELVRRDEKKTEQLQHLENGNKQLCLSLTEKREQQQKLEQALEEMRLREAAALKTQADLMDENLDLSRRLGENKVLSDSLQGEKNLLERENDLLRKESCRLLSYQRLNFDSLLPRAPAWNQEGKDPNPGLVFGNPYSGTQERSSPGPVRCPAPLRGPQVPKTFRPLSVPRLHGADVGWKQRVTLSPGASEERQQAQGHSRMCLICNKTFAETEKQIFEDHVFCHYLDQTQDPVLETQAQHL